MVNQNFHEENTTNNILGTRDTSCVFENLKMSENSASKKGAEVTEKEEFEPSFVSLVVSSTVGSESSL
jgi:hypothetical protein